MLEHICLELLERSVNGILNTCYLLKTLSSETFKQTINNFKGIVENVT